MGKAADAFAAQVSKGEAKIVAEHTETIRSIGLQAYRDLTQRAWDVGRAFGSPVASGRFAASMRLSLNQLDKSVAPEDKAYRYPTPEKHKRNANNLPGRTIRNLPLSQISLVLRRFKLGDTIYISNSVPYVRRIEVGGHSWQTPGGVFAPTIRKIAKQFARVKVRRGGL